VESAALMPAGRARGEGDEELRGHAENISVPLLTQNEERKAVKGHCACEEEHH